MAEVVSMPKLGFDMAEGTLVRWVVHEGEQIEKGSVLAEIETDKATVEVESTYDGVVSRHLVSEGDIVPINTPIAVIAEPDEEVDYQSLLGETGSTTTAKQEAVEEENVEEVDELKKQPVETVLGNDHLPGGVKASPVARRMAEEKGIDLLKVNGSGPGGRIVKQDIQSYIKAPSAPSAPETAVAVKEAQLPYAPIGAQALETQTVPLSRLRAAIGRRMTESKQQVPHFYVTHEYNMGALLDLRHRVNGLLPEDQQTSVNDYILKGVALALREFPNLNASLEGDHVVRHGQINIGVAVSVEGGLLTVVCRDADRKSVRMISSEVRAMVSRARDGKVKVEDIEGSTFSVSNMGMFDVENFIAIINPPEAAILAVGSAREVPVVEQGHIVPGIRMKASIAVDHRVSDGAEAARFLQALEKYLEEPLHLLM